METKKRRKAALTVRTACSTASSLISERGTLLAPSSRSMSGGGAIGKALAALDAFPSAEPSVASAEGGRQNGATALYSLWYCLCGRCICAASAGSHMMAFSSRSTWTTCAAVGHSTRSAASCASARARRRKE